MLEADWWNGDAPEKLLPFAVAREGIELSRIFAVACCHRIAGMLPDDFPLALFDQVTTQVVDGVNSELQDMRDHLARLLGHYSQTELERNRAAQRARNAEVRQEVGAKKLRALANQLDARVAGMRNAVQALKCVAILLRGPYSSDTSGVRWAEEVRSSVARAALNGLAERRTQANHLRCLVGDPFRKVPFCEKWRTPVTCAVAKALNQGDIESLVLADALEELGCEHPGVLGHCRSQTQHTENCWVKRWLLAAHDDVRPRRG